MTNKQELVTKSNRLIEAGYRLTLGEQRLILFAITEARKIKISITADTLINIKASEYAITFDIPAKQAYEQLKESALNLYRREIFLYDTHPETGKPRTIPARWVSSAPYIDSAGMVQLRFSPDVLPFISRLESEFTRYKLENIAGMSSAHAVRLYEILLQYGSIGKRELEISWLKSRLMIEDEYAIFSEFKRRVVEVAVTQINQYSDLTCSYTQKKTGRAVTHLLFEFAPKETAAKAVKTARKSATKGKPKATPKTPPKAPKNDTVIVEPVTTSPPTGGRSAESIETARMAIANLKKMMGINREPKPEPKPERKIRTREEIQAEVDKLKKLSREELRASLSLKMAFG